MRRSGIGILLIIMLNNGVLAYNSVPIEPPLYTLVFYAEEQDSNAIYTTQVAYAATYTEAIGWQVKPLAEDIMWGSLGPPFFALPTWSINGQSLYLMQAYSDSQADDQIPRLLHYDVPTKLLSPLMDFSQEATRNHYPADIDAISPDEQFIWLNSPSGEKSYLVDLQEKRIIYTLDCYVAPLVWLPDRVLVSDGYASSCHAMLYTIHLETGSLLDEFPLPEDEQGYWEDSFLYDVQPLSDNKWLIGGTNLTPMGIFDGASQTFSYVEQWANVARVSEDGSHFAYLLENQLVYRDSTRQQVTALGTALDTFYWTDNILNYWQIRTENEQWSLIFTQYEAGEYNREVVYSGVQPAYGYVSPDTPFIMLVFGQNDVDHWQLYTPDSLVFDSQQAFPNGEYVFIGPSVFDPGDNINGWEGYWSHDRQWLHLPANHKADGLKTTISINTQTGEYQVSPVPGYVYINASPDDVWWLYAESALSDVAVYGDYRKLLGNNHLTGEIVYLYQGTQKEHYPVNFSPIYYLWSPF